MKRPDGAPCKAIEIRIAISCHTWDEVERELPRETARVLKHREQAGHVYACGYGPSGTIAVFTRDVTAEQHAEELEAWIEAERARKEASHG